MLWKGLHGTETLLLVSRFSAGQGGSCCILHSPIEACPGPLHCMGLALRLAQGRWEDVDCWAGPRCPAFPPEAEDPSRGTPQPRVLFLWLPGVAGPLPQGQARGAWNLTVLSHLTLGVHLSCLLDLGPCAGSSTSPRNNWLRQLLHGTREGFRLSMGLAARW